MQPNQIKSRKLLVGVVAGFLALVAIILVIFVIYLNNNAILDLVVAPSFADVEINGKPYTTGTYRLAPNENVTATITADGFTTKEVSFSLINGDTTQLYVYLIPEDGNMDWYIQHPSEMMILNTIGDTEAAIASAAYREDYPISTILPILVVEVNPETYDWTEFRIDSGNFENCKTEYCVKITDSTGGNRQRALNIIREKGFNPDDYEIIYEYTPVEN